MALPSNFSSLPHEHPHKYFHNLIIEFRKAAKTTKNISELSEKMDRLLNASKDMKWKLEKKEIYHKDDAPKAMEKVFSEFGRYIDDLRKNPQTASPIDLISSLEQLQRIIEENKII